jgi:hypothetical protein
MSSVAHDILIIRSNYTYIVSEICASCAVSNSARSCCVYYTPTAASVSRSTIAADCIVIRVAFNFEFFE